MAGAGYEAMRAQVAKTLPGMASAAALIRGIKAKLEAGIAAAIAAGATAEELTQLQVDADQLGLAEVDLAAAVVEAGTEPGPVPEPRRR